ncbi:headcase protein homolog [Tubulanus polymorphus]|uniref:headcase protein homolog n=1 Tax=Tubulanus polymorphus TaxID=672921 RepID=UPI003DA41DFE
MPRHRHNSSKHQNHVNHGKNKVGNNNNHVNNGNGVVGEHVAARQQQDDVDQQQQQQQQQHDVENRDPRLNGHVELVECCAPPHCDLQEHINVNEPEDAVRIVCNNDKCTVGRWMHRACFEEWEQSVLAYLRSCGRARSWSEKQRLQNLWTKKGYDLAYKACDCKCGRGHLRKDLDYIPPTPTQLAAAGNDKGKKRNKKRNEKPMPVMSNNPRHSSNPQIVPIQRDRSNSNPHQHNEYQRVRHLSLTSTGSSPPSSASESGSKSPEDTTPPSTPCTPIVGVKAKFDFFNDVTQAMTGNIFKKRKDFSSFGILPRQKRNPYHIKMEDDGPHGNDDTRCFILSHLSTYKATSVGCVLCKHKMNVYDKYPLIDGTFFLSPVAYTDSAYAIMSDGKLQFLQAACMQCLEGGMAVFCNQCKRRWDGSTLILGTMYSYDIFAATPCCQKRLSCKSCNNMILGPLGGYQYYSEYSHVIQCPSCKVEDYHFVKPLIEQFFIHPTASICK